MKRFSLRFWSRKTPTPVPVAPPVTRPEVFLQPEPCAECLVKEAEIAKLQNRIAALSAVADMRLNPLLTTKWKNPQKGQKK